MDIRKYSTDPCPIARALLRVGDSWSVLILRDAGTGLTRFDQFQKSLGIAPNILTRRLAALVEAGMLEKRRYSERPPRDEYLLTAPGRDFLPVVMAIGAWGGRYFGEGGVTGLVDAESGRPIEPVVVDRATGRPIGTFPMERVLPS